MGNTATKRGRPKKPKKGTAAHKAAAIRRSSKAPNKRDSAAYLLSAKNKRSPKALSYASLGTFIILLPLDY